MDAAGAKRSAHGVKHAETDVPFHAAAARHVVPACMIFDHARRSLAEDADGQATHNVLDKSHGRDLRVTLSGYLCSLQTFASRLVAR